MQCTIVAMGLLPLSLLVIPGCAKDDPKGTTPVASANIPPLPSATASAAVAPPPSSSSAVPVASESPIAGTPAPTCPAGMTGNAVPTFCIKLPPSYH